MQEGQRHDSDVWDRCAHIWNGAVTWLLNVVFTHRWTCMCCNVFCLSNEPNALQHGTGLYLQLNDDTATTTITNLLFVDMEFFSCS